ncbi:MAG: PTS IIA-like nitrogen regulatory protein PtsN [Burkholderiales bacterium]
MTLISRILLQENVLLPLDASSKKRVFEQVGQLVEKNNHIARNLVFESLFNRERLGSTGLGEGVAIPHGRIKGLRDVVGAFVRLRTPIAFDAPDGKPVSLLFVLLVPERATDLHLQILGELAQMFSDASLRKRLEESDDAAHIHDVLTSYSPDGPDKHTAAI